MIALLVFVACVCGERDLGGGGGGGIKLAARCPGVLGGAVAQSAERETPGEEVPGSIPAVAARSLLVGSVSV